MRCRAAILGAVTTGLVVAIVLVASFKSPSTPHPSWLEGKGTDSARTHAKTAALTHIAALQARKASLTSVKRGNAHEALHAVKKAVAQALADKQAGPKAEAKLTFAQLEEKAQTALASGHTGAAHEAATALRLKAAADAKISSQTAMEATRDSKASDKIERQVERIRKENKDAAWKQAHAEHNEGWKGTAPAGKKDSLETYVKEQAELAHYEYELAHKEGDAERERGGKREDHESTDALVGQLSSFLHAAKAHGFDTHA